MPPLGTRIRVLYPKYAEGLKGYIQAQEGSGRWIVILEQNPSSTDQEPVLLSLEEQDFQIIELPTSSNRSSE